MISKVLQKFKTLSFQRTHQFSASKPFDKIEILKSETHDINFNLATEEFLYEHSTLTHPILFLWRNDRTIVIGRHQNPWKECYLQRMDEDKINLARRKTGGGAVYQDLGNSVFSFLTPAQQDQYPLDTAKKVNNQILIGALKNLGINAEISGRNDLLCSGKKISGSAYKLNLGKPDGSGKKVLHHGTMLLNLQSQDLQKYLNPNKAKLKSKGVDSVISRVTNLVEVRPDITHEMFCDEVENEFIRLYGSPQVLKKTLDKSELDKNQKINDIYQKSISWEWLHGSTPKFSNSIENRFEWGIIDFNFEVEKSLIVKAQVFSDCLFADFISTMNELLASESKYIYDVKGMKQFCSDLREKVQENDDFVKYVNEIENWIVNAI